MQLSAEQNAKIAQLYLMNFTYLMIYANTVLKDRDLAEEVVQDTFHIACAKADELLSSPNPGGWLTNTLKNIIRNKRKIAARKSRYLSTTNLDEAFIPESLQKTELELDLSRQLSIEEYQLYQLIFVEEATLQAAADQLGITLSACKKRVQRLKHRIRDILSE